MPGVGAGHGSGARRYMGAVHRVGAGRRRCLESGQVTSSAPMLEVCAGRGVSAGHAIGAQASAGPQPHASHTLAAAPAQAPHRAAECPCADAAAPPAPMPPAGGLAAAAPHRPPGTPAAPAQGGCLLGRLLWQCLQAGDGDVVGGRLGLWRACPLHQGTDLATWLGSTTSRFDKVWASTTQELDSPTCELRWTTSALDATGFERGSTGFGLCSTRLGPGTTKDRQRRPARAASDQACPDLGPTRPHLGLAGRGFGWLLVGSGWAAGCRWAGGRAGGWDGWCGRVMCSGPRWANAFRVLPAGPSVGGRRTAGGAPSAGEWAG